MENKHEEQRKQFWMDAWIACRNKGSGVQSCIDVADDALKALDERFPNPKAVESVNGKFAYVDLPNCAPEQHAKDIFYYIWKSEQDAYCDGKIAFYKSVRDEMGVAYWFNVKVALSDIRREDESSLNPLNLFEPEPKIQHQANKD